MTEEALLPKRIIRTDGFTIELDLASQVLEIDTAPDLFDLGHGVSDKDVPVRAKIDDLDKSEFISASLLAQKAKIFDDGLYAAVDMAAQNGAGSFKGKAALLRSLGKAHYLLLAAAQLGGVSVPDVPKEFLDSVQPIIDEFLADELRSKPIGFYIWSEELSRIFRQDRMLQTELRNHEELEILVKALRADESARVIYETYLRLISRLTNPLSGNDLRKLVQAMDQGLPICPEGKTIFFPPSIAHETEIVKKLYRDRPIPDDFVLVEEMIARIRSGQLDLAPGPESGWYDHQTWSLEPLVIPERMPEAAHLSLSDEYRKLLIELFKGILALTRETHIKQLELPVVGMAGDWKRKTIDVLPELSLEPLPTFYLRRALSYRFVRSVLEECFGAGELERIHRLTQDGPVSKSLAEELSEMEAIFIGAHATASHQLGMYPDNACGNSSQIQEAMNRFTAWATEPGRDTDISKDLRMMVPLFLDLQRNKTKVWAFLGWSQRPISIGFATPPESRFSDSGGQVTTRHPEIRWGGLYEQLACPVTVELYVDRILDRDEFRKLCDACSTQKEILRRLGVFPQAAEM
jgi:hypothetical protein